MPGRRRLPLFVGGEPLADDFGFGRADEGSDFLQRGFAYSPKRSKAADELLARGRTDAGDVVEQADSLAPLLEH